MIDVVVAHKNLQLMFLYFERQPSPEDKPIRTIRAADEKHRRRSQLVFLSDALEHFRQALDSIKDLVVLLDLHSPNDLRDGS